MATRASCHPAYNFRTVFEVPGSLDSCINNVYEDGNIPASSGLSPVRIVMPPDIPDDYDPDEVEYSLDFTRFYNSSYMLLLMV